jgi:glycosyltransferase involved in cell wall biosynthesis
MAKTKKILFLSFCRPNKNGTGWEKRAYSVLQEYCKIAFVEVWFLRAEDDRLEDFQELTSLNCLVKCLDGREVYGNVQNKFKFYLAIFSLNPFAVNFLVQEKFAQELKVKVGQVDTIHVFRDAFWFIHLFMNLKKNIIFDCDEVPWNIRPQREENINERPVGFIMKWDNYRIRRYYKKILIGCKKTFVSSELERMDMESFSDNISVLRNVTCRETELTDDDETIENVAIFVGNFNYFPNQEAVDNLCKNIWPQIIAEIPTAKLLLVGRQPLMDWQPYLLDGVEIHYNPDSLSPFYSKASISVNPVMHGGGTRIKSIEAFAYKCPVVCTKIGIEGIEVIDEKEVLVSYSNSEFAQNCIRCFQDKQLRIRLQENAYRFWQENHTQGHVKKIISEMINSL